jgi:hypothetical protein
MKYYPYSIISGLENWPRDGLYLSIYDFIFSLQVSVWGSTFDSIRTVTFVTFWYKSSNYYK